MRTELREYRTLWRDAFGDTETYMDYFFDHKAPRSEVWSDQIEGHLCAMAFFIPYDAVLFGESCRIPYIVGVATEEKHRHEGRMTRVLKLGMQRVKEERGRMVFLSPADPKIYEPLGFVPVYWRETTYAEGRGTLSLNIERWDSLDGEQKERAAAFADERLRREGFELYLSHHRGYYDEVNRELQSLDGSVLVLRQQGEIVAVANWIQEDGVQEITELICRRELAHRVLESLLAYVPDEKLTVDDSVFLSGIRTEKQGIQIRREKQSKPYLMCRMLDGSGADGLRCYINDIT